MREKYAVVAANAQQHVGAFDAFPCPHVQASANTNKASLTGISVLLDSPSPLPFHLLTHWVAPAPSPALPPPAHPPAHWSPPSQTPGVSPPPSGPFSSSPPPPTTTTGGARRDGHLPRHLPGRHARAQARDDLLPVRVLCLCVCVFVCMCV